MEQKQRNTRGRAAVGRKVASALPVYTYRRGVAVRRPLWNMFRLALLALLGGALAGCASQACCEATGYLPPAIPLDIRKADDAGLQACVDHASAAQKANFDDFRLLRFDSRRLVRDFSGHMVGSQYVGTVYDGYGARYGAKEYRLVRFHCLRDASGAVVYSFVRGE